MTAKEIDIKSFIKDTFEAIFAYVTPEGVYEPLEHAAEIVAPKHSFEPEQFKWLSHSFYWFIVENKFVLQDYKPSNGHYYVYMRNVDTPDLEAMTEDFFKEHGSYLEARIKNVKAGEF